MTAPDRPVQDVIAEAMRAHFLDLNYVSPDKGSRCVCLGWADGDDWDDHLAAAVVAACREATVEQQAELTGCDYETAPFFDADVDATEPSRRYVQSRLVGRWREDPS